jgi:hypothetical protein
MTHEFTPQYTTLGNDRGFRDQEDFRAYLEATIGDVLNEQLQWDLFARGADGRYYGVGVEVKVRELPIPEAGVLRQMDETGLIPKGLGTARLALLEAYYDADREVKMLEAAYENDGPSAEGADADQALLDAALARLAEVTNKLAEVDRARQANRAEAETPPDDAELERRAEALGAVGREAALQALVDHSRSRRLPQ